MLLTLPLSHVVVSSDFGAHPPWNTIIVVGATFNFLLLWLLTYVSSLWVGFPMWMWSGRALIIQVAAETHALLPLSPCLNFEQHRGDMSGPESSILDILKQIAGQFAAEYLLYPRLREQVKEAFATGNFT